MEGRSSRACQFSKVGRDREIGDICQRRSEPLYLRDEKELTNRSQLSSQEWRNRNCEKFQIIAGGQRIIISYPQNPGKRFWYVHVFQLFPSNPSGGHASASALFKKEGRGGVGGGVGKRVEILPTLVEKKRGSRAKIWNRFFPSA